MRKFCLSAEKRAAALPYFSFILLFNIGFSLFSVAQTKKLTIEDAVSNPKLNPLMLKQLRWLPETDKYVYATEVKGTEYLVTGYPEGQGTDTLVAASTLIPGKKKFPRLTWISDTKFVFLEKGKLFAVENAQSKNLQAAEVASFGEDAENIVLHPNGTAAAFTKGGNLYIASAGGIKTVTSDKTEGVVHGQSVHRQEFGINEGSFWSGKGNLLAFYRMDQSMVTDYPIVNLNSTPAKVEPVKYPMAGQKSHQVTVGIYSTTNEKTIYLQTGEPAEQYLTNIAFGPDEQTIYIMVLNRAQDHMKLNAYSTQTGAFIKTLFEEKSDKWVEPLEPIVFLKTQPDKFIYQSIRDGANNVYLYNTQGTLLKQLTKGDEAVTEVLGFNKAEGVLYYTLASNKALDRQLYCAGINTGEKLAVTSVPGTHNALPSPSGRYYLDTWSSLTSTPVSEVCKFGPGSAPKVLHKPADPLSDFALPKTELLTLKAPDGTPLNARITKPADFDPKKKYPVLVYLYNGSHVQLVTNSRFGGANLWMNYMAQQGYIVFSLDGRGSYNRSRNFQQATFRQLGTAEAEDQMQGVKYLKSLPYTDSTRFGIHGWSFGGFMTTNLMTRYPKTFKVGVAGGPVIDWALYEVMYTERYMDTPQENPEGYAKANLLNQAKNLEGRLMLIHGTSDDVVVWQHSQLFVKKCVEEGKLLDYFVYPGHAHNVQGKDRLHLMRTITRYFENFL